MLANTKLRTKLVAIAVPPMLVLAIVAAYGAFATFLTDSMSADELQGDLKIISILAIVGIICSILAVIAMRDRIMAPILEVTEGARELAEHRLPVLIEGLRDPKAEIPEFDPIDFTQTNELGDLAAALNLVQTTAGEISAEQKNIFKRGISDLVVNLARRNQSLLDRQIESIDRLESDEEDPDRLEQLFSLDHLATRMRRNAESLLVLAGSEPARRRGGPVALADVLRVAMSEIEDYRKVQLSNMEQAEIGAQSAVDLAHLMSELMENATQFSPPDSAVEVKGALDEAGSYVIGIIDHGIGMNDEQLLAANDLLRNPPDLGITLTRSLGFLVVGQLSKRLGVGVELVKTAGSGTTAIVVVPAALLAGGVRQSVQESPIPGSVAQASHATEAPNSSSPVVEAPARWAAPAAPAFEAPVLDAPPQWEQPAPETDFDVPAVELLSAGEPIPPASQAWEPPAPQAAPSFEAPASEAQSFEAPPFEDPAAPGWDAPQEAPAPSFEAPEDSFEAPAAPGWDAPQEAPAPSFEAPPFEAPAQSFEAPPFEDPAPSFEAPPFEDAAPSFEAPPFEAPAPAESFEAPPFEAPATRGWDSPQPAPEPVLETPASAIWDQPAPTQDQTPHLDHAAHDDWLGAEPDHSEPASAERQPIDWANEPEPSSAPSADYIPGWDDPIDAPAAPAEHQRAPAAEHVDPLAAAFQTPVPGQMPPVSRLDQAIPTGEQFDAGVEELLQEPQDRTNAGLARRDRSTSQAPTSESRPIAASVRSPDEVRNMLARYRSGLKGNPGNGDQS